MKYLLIFLTIIILIPASPAFTQDTKEDIEAQKIAEAQKMANESAARQNFEAQDKIIDPDEYIVGPGDELTIFFYGSFTREVRILITPEGSLLIPEFGEVYIGQIKLSEAKQKVLNALRKSYRNVEISITLSNLRKIKVSVDGEVYFPGVYTVSSIDRSTEAIKLAGGLKETASRRNIMLNRNGKNINIDLLSFARTGQTENNPYLIEGDKIFVPPMQTKVGVVEIYGPVKVPDEYEFVGGERISDLLALAGGLRINADTNSAVMVRFEESHNMTNSYQLDLKDILLNPGSENDWLLQPDDRIFIRAIPNYHPKAVVVIDGEVEIPGTYPVIEDTTTLYDVIQRAGGFTPLASLDEAKMYRFGYNVMGATELDRQLKLSTDQLTEIEREYLLLRSDPDQGRISIDFEELFSNNNMSYNVTLKDRDRIIIPRISNTVRIMGRVLRPGLVTYHEGAMVDYYVEKCGGFTKSANKGNIRIIKGTTGAITKPSKKIPIEVGDEILVPEKRDINWWEVTKDVGLFLANMATVYIVVDQIID